MKFVTTDLDAALLPGHAQKAAERCLRDLNNTASAQAHPSTSKHIQAGVFVVFSQVELGDDSRVVKFTTCACAVIHGLHGRHITPPKYS